MYKLLVSDFYNTLIDDDEAICLSTMVEIDRIRKSGILFVIATGGSVHSIMSYNRDFPFIDYIIACNGACLYDVNLKKIVFKKNIMPSLVKKIKKIYNECEICFYTLDKEVIFGKNDSFDSFYNENKNSIYKMDVFFANKKLRDSAYSEIEELDLKICLNKSEKNKKNVIEITALDIDKMAGINWICKKHKISLTEVVAIGDSDNDISMIENVGMGVCVSNATKEVKKISKMKSSSNICKGVEKVIKKFFE